MGGAGANPSASTLHFTNSNFDIEADVQFNLTWEGAKTTTTLSLQNGTASSIETVDEIAYEFLKNNW